ncbi:MAG: UbiA prenyltransferase family protein [Thermoplasmata archaeon]|nr:MAG: UbiA prenyltransferase family protein [Thermoplasmata archaeon]
MTGRLKGLIITMRPVIGIVTFPWVAAMALFASIEYGDFSSPVHGDTLFYTKLLLIVLASYLGVTSGYAVNDYYDAELDMGAPIPKAVQFGIPKKTLLGYAAILGIPSLLILFYLSVLTGIVGIIQMLSIFTYSRFMKGRVTYSNMFVVLPTALMPLGVFFVYTHQITLEAVLLLVILFFYEPGFTWSGVCRDMEVDKMRGVPTLPVKYGIRHVAQFILLCWLVVLLMSIVLFAFTGLGFVFLMGSVISAVILIKLAVNLIKDPNPGLAAKTFIESSLWFWLFSVSIILDVSLRMGGLELMGVNLL